MAYNIEYYYEYYNIGGLLERVELLVEESASDSGAVGTAIMDAGDHPVELRHSGQKNNFEDTIIQGQELIFRFWVAQADVSTFDALLESDYKDYKVRYYIDNQLEFEGYVKPENLIRDYTSAAPYVEFILSATDALADLRNIPFGDGTIVNDTLSLLAVIKEALTPTDLTLDFHVQLGTYESTYMTSTECVLEVMKVDTRRFIDWSGGRQVIKSCWEVIEDVLKDFNVTFKQYKGYYQITNHNELDSYEFEFDWATLTEQSRTATDNIVDISSYEVNIFPELQKIRPLKQVGVTFRNKDLGGDVTGMDLTDWDGVWTIDFYSYSHSAGVATLSSKSSVDPSVNENSLTLNSDFNVTKLTENDYLKLEFDHQIFSYIGSGTPAVRIKVEITQPDETVVVSNVYLSCNSDWQHFESDLNNAYKVVESGDYNVKITFIDDPYDPWYWYSASPVMFLKMKDVMITKVVNVLEGDDLETVTFDKHYVQTSDVGFDVYETETVFGDGGQTTEIGALLFEDSAEHITDTWRTYGHTEDIKLLDVYARNILNNRYQFKNYLRVVIHDRGNTIGFNSIITINSRNYTFVSFQRDGQYCTVKADLMELLTAQQSYGTIAVSTLTTVDGYDAQGSTNVTYAIPASAPYHNELSGLYGDSPYYHLSSSDYTNVGNLDTMAYESTDDYYLKQQLDDGALNGLYYTETELNEGCLDGRYYTETETDSLLAAKATISGTPVDNQVAVWTGATDIEGSSKLTFDDTLEVGVTHAASQDEEIRIGSYYLSNFYGLGLNYRIDDEGDPSTHIVYYSGGERFTDITLDDNKVGILCSEPLTDLQIGGDSAANRTIRFHDSLHYWDWTHITADNRMNFGYDGTEKMFISSTGTIQEPNFTSGFQGTNWQITAAGNAEFRNVLISGGLQVYELILNQLHYQCGGLIIGAGGGKVKTIDTATVGSEKMYFEDPEGNAIVPFTVGAIVMVQRFDLNRTTVVKKIVRQVATVAVELVGLTTTAGWVVGSDVGIFEAGDEIVAIGHVSDTGLDASIYMSAVDSDNPFIRIFDGVDSYADWSLSTKTCVKAQFGNLESLAGYDIVPAGPGFGVYSDNVYLKGKIVASSGEIGSWTIDSDAIYTGTKKVTDGYTAAGVTLDSNGALRGTQFYINSDGDCAFRQIEEAVFKQDGDNWGIKIQGGQIWENEDNADDSTVYINYKGYEGGTTKFRDLRIGNGKVALGGGLMCHFDGSANSIYLRAPTFVNTWHLYTRAIINNYAVDDTYDHFLVCNNTGGAITIDLPASPSDGRVLIIKKRSTSLGVTLDGGSIPIVYTSEAYTYVLSDHECTCIVYESSTNRWFITSVYEPSP